jgi:hypothetical protein
LNSVANGLYARGSIAPLSYAQFSAFFDSWKARPNEDLFQGKVDTSVPLWRSMFKAELPRSWLSSSLQKRDEENHQIYKRNVAHSSSAIEKGCYKGNIFTGTITTFNDPATVEKCVKACQNNDYAALRGNICQCGTNAEFLKGKEASGKCTLKCGGNVLQPCGGQSEVSVYVVPKMIEKEITESMAQDHCSKHITGGLCYTVVKPERFVKSCVEDALLMKSFALADSSKYAYLKECFVITDRMVSSSDPAERERGIKIQIANSLGKNACPVSCNGQKCGNAGCECSSGYYGQNCEKKALL